VYRQTIQRGGRRRFRKKGSQKKKDTFFLSKKLCPKKKELGQRKKVLAKADRSPLGGGKGGGDLSEKPRGTGH